MKTSSQENGINKRKQISDLLNELKYGVIHRQINLF